MGGGGAELELAGGGGMSGSGAGGLDWSGAWAAEAAQHAASRCLTHTALHCTALFDSPRASSTGGLLESLPCPAYGKVQHLRPPRVDWAARRCARQPRGCSRAGADPQTHPHYASLIPLTLPRFTSLLHRPRLPYPASQPTTDGSLQDACLLAALAALSSLRLHAVTVDEAGRIQKAAAAAAGTASGQQPAAGVQQQGQKFRRLELGCLPISLTCGLYHGRLLVDPTAEEEPQMEALLSATLDEGGAVLGKSRCGCCWGEGVCCIGANADGMHSTSRAQHPAKPPSI